MTERAWRWLLLALTIGVLAAVLDAQPRTVTLGIGRFGATDPGVARMLVLRGPPRDAGAQPERRAVHRGARADRQNRDADLRRGRIDAK